MDKEDNCSTYNTYCACLECRRISYCLDDPCEVCDGPVSERCCTPFFAINEKGQPCHFETEEEAKDYGEIIL